MFIFNAIKNSISRQIQGEQVQKKDTIIEKTKDLYDSSVFIGFKEGPNQIKNEITIEYKNDKVLNKIKELENEQEWEFINSDIHTKIDEVLLVQPSIEEDIIIVEKYIIDNEKTIIEYEKKSKSLGNLINDFEAMQKKDLEIKNMMNTAKKRISELTISMRKSKTNEEIIKFDDEQKRLSDSVVPTFEDDLHKIRDKILNEKPQYTKNLLTLTETNKEINKLKSTREILERIYENENLIIKNLSKLKNMKVERDEKMIELNDLRKTEKEYSNKFDDINKIEKILKDPKTKKSDRDFNSEQLNWRKIDFENYRNKHEDELNKIYPTEVNINQLNNEIERIERDTIRIYLDLKEDKENLFL